jgi:hypothetical protein
MISKNPAELCQRPQPSTSKYRSSALYCQSCYLGGSKKPDWRESYATLEATGASKPMSYRCRNPQLSYDCLMGSTGTSFNPTSETTFRASNFRFTRYLGPDAWVSPAELESCASYMITAYRTLTSQMLKDIKLDSARWQAEYLPRVKPNWLVRPKNPGPDMVHRSMMLSEPTAKASLVDITKSPMILAETCGWLLRRVDGPLIPLT